VEVFFQPDAIPAITSN